MTLATYRSRPTRRTRRTKTEMAAVRDAIREVALDDHPVTCRQVFYRLVSEGIVEKRESEYKAVVIRLLGEMRRRGELPFSWIADNTRWMRKPQTFSSLQGALEHTANFYRRAVWDEQTAYVEIWLEKDALAGVLYPVTQKYDVPLMVTRGYPSLTFLHSAAECIDMEQKPAYLYYFGDLDPSGLDISRVVESGIREFAPLADVHFERVAVTEEQVDAWQLPTRPTKTTDTRAGMFKGESVEVDAIPPDQLRELVSDCITTHIDRHALESLQLAEQSERDLLRKIASGQNGSGGVLV